MWHLAQWQGIQVFQLLLLLALTSPYHVHGQRSPIVLDIQRSAHHDLSKRSSLVHRDVNHTVPLLFDKKISYYTSNITIGTPPQPLVVLIDPNSGDTTVLASSANLGEGKPHIGGTYDPTSSSTYQNGTASFAISLLNGGYTSGHYVTDTLVIGGSTMADFQLAVVFNGTDLNFNTLGLGFYDFEHTDKKYPNLLVQMKKNNMIDCMAYSLWFNDPKTSTGHLIIGGIDTGKFRGTPEILSILTTVNDQYMTIPLASLGVSNGPLFTKASLQIALSTGANNFFLPENVAQPLFSHLGFTYDSELSLATKACSSIDNSTSFNFTFGTTSFQVPLSELVLYEGTVGSETDVCALDIHVISGSSFFLGLPLIQRMYVVFDLSHNQVSVAALNQASSPSNITTIPSIGLSGFSSTAPGEPGVKSHTGGLSSGAKVGVAVGVFIGAVILLFAILCGVIVQRRKKAAKRVTPKPGSRRGYTQVQSTTPEIPFPRESHSREFHTADQKRAVENFNATQSHELQELPGSLPPHELEDPNTDLLWNYASGDDTLIGSTLSTSASKSKVPRRKPVGSSLSRTR